MKQLNHKASKYLKIGAVLFCVMCLFFAVNMASKYEGQKSQTEIHLKKAKELEERINELSRANQELMQVRQALVQEKEQLAKEISSLREKHPASEDWKLNK